MLLWHSSLPWKTIPWNFLCTVLELIWRPHEVWTSIATDLCALWPHHLTLYEVMLLPVISTLCQYPRSWLTLEYWGVSAFRDWSCAGSISITLTYSFTHVYSSLCAWFNMLHTCSCDCNPWFQFVGWVSEYFYQYSVTNQWLFSCMGLLSVVPLCLTAHAILV